MAEAGIDEAGRGPVFGPLVVAAVRSTNTAILTDMEVRDSKKIPAARRERMARLIRDEPTCKHVIITRSAEEIDELRKNQTLNEIEVEMFREAFVALDDAKTRWFLDAADVDEERFGRLVSPEKTVVSKHGADDKYVVVGAASIIAKVARDDAMKMLQRRLERKLPYNVGSGYPSDPSTKSFLAAYVEKFGEFPEGTRKSWKTAQRLLPKAPSKTLKDF